MADITNSLDNILISQDNGIAIMTLNREAQLNALTKAMWNNLNYVIDGLRKNKEVRCLILRGAGTRAFSPGNDIKEFETERSGFTQARDYGALMEKSLKSISEFPAPTIAMIHGICVGGGMEIAGSCDLRICGQSSRFGIPIAKLGLVMSYPELTGLIRLVGHSKAIEILLEARIYNAEEAREMGIVTRVVKDEEVEIETLDTARRIADGAPLVHQWHKKFVQRLRNDEPLNESELDESFACFETEDFDIGRRAFVRKLKPLFKGC